MENRSYGEQALLEISLAFESSCGPFLRLSNPPTVLLTSASSSSCCVAASRSLRIHSFHETGQSQSSIQAAQAKREGKRSAPCWAVTPEGGQRNMNSAGTRRGRAETQHICWAWGKRSWNSARARLSSAKRTGRDIPYNTSQGVTR